MFRALLIVASLTTTSLAQCPQPANKNIIENGGFGADASSDSIAPWVINAEAPGKPPNAGLRSPGYKSTYCFGTGPPMTHDQRYVNLTQSFKGCRNQAYIMSFRYKFVDSRYPNQAIMYTPIGDLFQGFPDVPSRLNNTWEYYAQYFVNGTGVDIQADLSSTKKGEIFIDDVRILPQSKLVAAPGAPNLLKNGHFESGSLSPWTGNTTQYCSVSTPGDNSTYAFNCIFPESPMSFPVSTIRQTIATTPNGHYLLSFDYTYSNPSVAGHCELEYGLNRLTRFPNVQRVTGRSTGPWYHYEHGIVTPSDVTNLYFQISTYSTFGPCNVSIDNILFKEIG